MASQSHSVHSDPNDGHVEDLEILESISPSDVVGSECEKEKPSKKSRTNTSVVWDFFSQPVDGKVTCKECKKAYAWNGSNYGTSTLKRHINACKSNPKFKDVGNMILDCEGKLRSKKIDQKYLRELLSRTIISHDLPLSFVEYKWVRELIKYLNPDATNISRLTATTDILKLYSVEKERLRRVMIDSPSRICLTSDCWTACTSEGYICLTAHFVDSNWKLNSKILSFCKMEPPHTGFDLAKKVRDCLIEWGIEKKIFSLTLDNASANDSMQNFLKETLAFDGNLFCKGKFFHIRCCAHILNLIVQDGLKVANEALSKIRDSIKYVKASEGRMKSFFECVSRVGGIDTKVGLRLDVPTRWNSTYIMLESATKYKRAFSRFQAIDRNYNFAPTDEEWARGEKMCEFLRPFFVITNLISGTSYPTSNLYFMQIWKIECFLKANVESDDDEIKNVSLKMKEKFHKYWSDYSLVLAFGAVLDPRAKLGMIEYCYSQLDPYTAQEKVAKVKGNMQMLFSEYTNWISSIQPIENSSQPSESIFRNSSNISHVATQSVGDKEKERVGDFNLFDVIQDWQSKSSNNQNEKSALDQYLDEPPLDIKYFPNLDVLAFWKDNKERWPALSFMACDILSIPITTVASESAFSIGARVLTKYRSRLLGNHVHAILCTRSWLQGFIHDEEELDDEVAYLSKEGSNVIMDDGA